MLLSIQVSVAILSFVAATILYFNRGFQSLRARLASSSSILPYEAGGSALPPALQQFRKLYHALFYFLPLLWDSSNVYLQLCFISLLVCLGLIRLVNASIPLQLGLIVDQLQVGDAPWQALLWYFLCRALSSGVGLLALQQVLWRHLETHAIERLGVAAYAHFMSLSKDYHEGGASREITQVIQRGRSVIGLLRIACFQIIPVIIDIAVGAEYLGGVIDGSLAVIAATSIVFLFVVSWKCSAITSSLQRRYITNMGVESQILLETSTNWITVAFFNQFDRERARYASALKSAQSSVGAFLLANTMTEGLKYLVNLLGLAVAALIAVHRIRIKGGKPGDFAMLIMYWGQLFRPLEETAAAFMQIGRSLVDAEAMLDLFRRKPAVVDSVGATHLKISRGKVRFTNVCFSHNESNAILNNLTFAIPGGSIVGIVGTSGAGKSTILNLLFRFYDVESGSIEIDDQCVADVTVESLRCNIAVAPQSPALFNASILDNLRYAKPDASVEECERACRVAMIHDAIGSFQDGYATTVGERGAKLSGGELQRIALAQAILKGSRIMLFDEASSNLDGATEKRIHDNIRDWRGDRTLFFVAHRLTTVVDADQILVVQEGRLVGHGAHNDLLATNAPYQQLWNAFYRTGSE